MNNYKRPRYLRHYPYIYTQKTQVGFCTPILSKKKGIFQIKGSSGQKNDIHKQNSAGPRKITYKHRKL